MPGNFLEARLGDTFRAYFSIFFKKIAPAPLTSTTVLEETCHLAVYNNTELGAMKGSCQRLVTQYHAVQLIDR